MVDDIYAQMTKRPTADGKDKPHGLQLGSWLPQVSTNIMAGLMERVAAPPYDGRADLPDIARTLQLDADELFPIAEILHHLGFADLRKATSS